MWSKVSGNTRLGKAVLMKVLEIMKKELPALLLKVSLYISTFRLNIHFIGHYFNSCDTLHNALTVIISIIFRYSFIFRHSRTELFLIKHSKGSTCILRFLVFCSLSFLHPCFDLKFRETEKDFCIAASWDPSRSGP